MLPLYPKDRITKPEDGISQVGDRVVVDHVTYVVGYISKYFDPSHVYDKVAPQTQIFIIDKDKNWIGKDYSDADYILIGPVTTQRQQVGINYSHQNTTFRGYIKFLAAYRQQDDDMRMARLVAEVESILTARRPFIVDENGLSIGGPSFVRWGSSESPEDRIKRGHTIKTIDFEIRRRWQNLAPQNSPGV